MTRDKATIKLNLGAMHCETLEEQLNTQGYTLGTKEEKYTAIAKSIAILNLHGYMQDSQADKARQKLVKEISCTVVKFAPNWVTSCEDDGSCIPRYVKDACKESE